MRRQERDQPKPKGAGGCRQARMQVAAARAGDGYQQRGDKREQGKREKDQRYCLGSAAIIASGLRREFAGRDRSVKSWCRVSNMVEIFWRRSPSVGIWALSGREVKVDRYDGLRQCFPAIDLSHLELA